ncbi:unnamed protein product [Durusdinium trenchii]|uniref:Fe2OG dioxygenase domain-containing protein n=2 Tax=Durusdinium trenchii TaxID=1381693 RepID=A0ABP0SZP5_9DINO
MSRTGHGYAGTTNGVTTDAGLGKKFSEAISANAREKQPPSQALVEDGRRLLEALMEAYMDAEFQREVCRLREEIHDELRFLTTLGPLAARAQEPVFQCFGLPPGQRGVILMKMGVRLLSTVSPDIKELAGDLRELLCLPREEEDITSTIKKAESEFQDLQQKIAAAPLELRGPLAEAFLLPYNASPVEIAQADIIGEGKLLGSDMAHASDETLQAKVQDMFERYLQKMLSRVITPLDSYTRAPEDFACSWARDLVSKQTIQDLWGSQTCQTATLPVRDVVEDLSSQLGFSHGVAILNDTVSVKVTRQAREELAALETAGAVTPSQDPCNVGARSVWLHFETAEEREKSPPALRELCEHLLGLPHALLAAAESNSVVASRLRVHPHIMAATYRRGAEYHCHKDSYSGTDNSRMVTILLYLNDWQPGDGGELRLFGTKQVDADVGTGPGLRDAASAPDLERFVDVAPLSGRVVMFRSREIWHAVREPREQRWAMTLWVMAD